MQNKHISSPKLVIVMAGWCFVLGSILYMYRDFWYVTSPFGVIVVMFGAALLSFYYLQWGGIKLDNHQPPYVIDEDVVKRLENIENNQSVRLADIEHQFERLKNNNSQGDVNNVFSEEDKIELIKDLKDGFYTDSTKEFLSDQIAKHRESVEKNTNTLLLDKTIKETKARLSLEIRNQGLRSNLNLVIGMVVTSIGVYLLWDMVSALGATTILTQAGILDSVFYKNMILRFVPRISLVLFIEIFAYFFLRLYKEGLSEIKYFQNELTNVDLKFVALVASNILTLNDAMIDVIKEYGKTERNYILKKGQTTVDLERNRLDGEVVNKIITAFPKIFNSKKE
jgi:hypothetical protein